jgi:hypothetical protein
MIQLIVYIILGILLVGNLALLLVGRAFTRLGPLAYLFFVQSSLVLIYALPARFGESSRGPWPQTSWLPIDDWVAGIAIHFLMFVFLTGRLIWACFSRD